MFQIFRAHRVGFNLSVIHYIILEPSNLHWLTCLKHVPLVLMDGLRVARWLV